MDFKSIKPIVLMTQLGISMLVPILMGVLLGRWLDSLLGTNPLLLILCCILGVITAFRNLFVLVKKMGDDDGGD